MMNVCYYYSLLFFFFTALLLNQGNSIFIPTFLNRSSSQCSVIASHRFTGDKTQAEELINACALLGMKQLSLHLCLKGFKLLVFLFLA